MRLNDSQERALRVAAEGDGYITSLEDRPQWRLLDALLSHALLRTETLAYETRWHLTPKAYRFLEELDTNRLVRVNSHRRDQGLAPYRTFEEVPRDELSPRAREVYP